MSKSPIGSGEEQQPCANWTIELPKRITTIMVGVIYQTIKSYRDVTPRTV